MHEAATQFRPTSEAAASVGEQLAFSIPHAARVLDLCDRKVWELVKDGEIESIKIGRSRRIPRAALLSYVEGLRSAA
jgi:excisionase family DNA binding protein